MRARSERYPARMRTLHRLAVPTSLACLALAATGCSGECAAPPADPSTSTASTAAAALGEPVAMTFAVKGMHCDGCEGAICGKVEKIDGVTAVKASHVDMKVDVTAPEAQREAIVAAIKRLGYTVE
jgi:copper chaperone CopZ